MRFTWTAAVQDTRLAAYAPAAPTLQAMRVGYCALFTVQGTSYHEMVEQCGGQHSLIFGGVDADGDAVRSEKEAAAATAAAERETAAAAAAARGYC